MYNGANHLASPLMSWKILKYVLPLCRTASSEINTRTMNTGWSEHCEDIESRVKLCFIIVYRYAPFDVANTVLPINTVYTGHWNVWLNVKYYIMIVYGVGIQWIWISQCRIDSEVASKRGQIYIQNQYKQQKSTSVSCLITRYPQNHLIFAAICFGAREKWHRFPKGRHLWKKWIVPIIPDHSITPVWMNGLEFDHFGNIKAQNYKMKGSAASQYKCQER